MIFSFIGGRFQFAIQPLLDFDGVTSNHVFFNIWTSRFFSAKKEKYCSVIDFIRFCGGKIQTLFNYDMFHKSKNCV